MPIAAPGKDNHPATYNENAIKKVREKKNNTRKKEMIPERQKTIMMVLE